MDEDRTDFVEVHTVLQHSHFYLTSKHRFCAHQTHIIVTRSANIYPRSATMASKLLPLLLLIILSILSPATAYSQAQTNYPTDPPTSTTNNFVCVNEVCRKVSTVFDNGPYIYTIIYGTDGTAIRTVELVSSPEYGMPTSVKEDIDRANSDAVPAQLTLLSMVWDYQKIFWWYVATILPCVVLVGGIITFFCYAFKNKDRVGPLERFSDLETFYDEECTYNYMRNLQLSSEMI
jgi:hypothetical protein